MDIEIIKTEIIKKPRHRPYTQALKASMDKYFLKNKDKIKEAKKLRYEHNKDDINFKIKMTEYNKIAYQRRKEKLKILKATEANPILT